MTPIELQRRLFEQVNEAIQEDDEARRKFGFAESIRAEMFTRVEGNALVAYADTPLGRLDIIALS